MFIHTHHIIAVRPRACGRGVTVYRQWAQREHGFFQILLHNFKVILFVYNIWKSGYANKFSTYVYTLCTKILLNPKRKLNQLQSLTGLEAEWRRFVAQHETNDTLLWDVRGHNARELIHRN